MAWSIVAEIGLSHPACRLGDGYPTEPYRMRPICMIRHVLDDAPVLLNTAALHRTSPYVAATDAGAIFGFSRKKLSGSYCALIWLSRAMFAPYAFAANAPAVSSACPVKFV
jgi:hypothetical protein